MKKKKLFASIASLALAISLLVFGVYSAGVVTFNVSNTVTYTFSDVLVDVTANLYQITTGTDSIVTSAELAGLIDTNWTIVTGGVTNGTLKSYTGTNGVYKQDDAASTVNSSIAFNMNTAFAYMVKIDFTTVSNSGVTVTYNDTAFIDDAADDNISLVVESNTANNAIIPGETYSFVYYVLLEDATKEVNVSLPSLSFNVNKTV
ncbi:MAG: hypothetical protein E7376_03825 [Clostridiales bacterium]|nr:hypothetical protein [Clostridiales bacterium]